jgi:hypothetical protein
MMTRSQLVAFADAIRAIQPEWSQSGTLKYLHQLSEAWKGTVGEFAAHVMSIAGDPESNTPAALTARPLPKPKAAQSKGPLCAICSRPRAQCDRQREWEAAHGVPDPHEFVTSEDAEERRVRGKQLTARQLTGLTKTVSAS